MRRLYITGYEHSGIRQYSVSLSKKKAKEFKQRKESESGVSGVFQSYQDVYSKESFDLTVEFYKDINRMLKQKPGMVEVNVNERTDEELEVEA